MIVGKVNMRYVAFVAVVAAVGGFLFGYDTAVISGTIDTVAGQFSLDALQKGWYVGCALVGSIFGVSVAGMLGDSIGRKRSMILSAVLFTVSAFGCAVSATFAELVAYRIVGGVGIGIVSVISPLYISVGAEASRTACVAVSVGDNGRIFRCLYGKLCFAAV